MKISLLPVAIIAVICVTFSMGINPFESTDNTESLAIVTDQLVKYKYKFKKMCERYKRNNCAFYI